MLSSLCMPALIYLIFATCHVIIDVYKQHYNSAFVKMWIGILITFLLNTLCEHDMDVVSWLIVSIPFLLMTALAGILLFIFGLNPATGQQIYTTPSGTTTTTPATTTTTPATTTTTPATTTTAPTIYSNVISTGVPPFPVNVGYEAFSPYMGALGNSKRPQNSNCVNCACAHDDQ